MRAVGMVVASTVLATLGWSGHARSAPPTGVALAPQGGVLPAPAGEPSGADRQAARQHANAGFRAFKSGNYQTAIEQFSAAERLVHAPPHVLYMARAYEKLGRLVEAREQYLALRDETLDPKAPAAFREAQKSADDELKELVPRIPRIALAIEAPAGIDALVRLDGTELPGGSPAEPLWVNPGKHEMRAEADGCTPASQDVEVAEGQGVVKVKLVLTPSGAPQPLPDPTTPGDGEGEDDEALEIPIGPTVLTVAGIAVLAVGGITGGLALDRASELRDTCPQNPCPTENESLADEANLLATISTVSFIAGGVATAAGVAWLIADVLGGDDPAEGEQPDGAAWRIEPAVGLGSVGLRGVLP